MEIVRDAVKPNNYNRITIKLTDIELLQAYHEQEHIYDICDIENEILANFAFYDREYDLQSSPVTDDEYDAIATRYRELLGRQSGPDISECKQLAVVYVLDERHIIPLF